MAHKLKILPRFFAQVLLGNKNFELRKNDRDFKVNDKITLKEWCPIDEKYTGRSIHGKITFLYFGGNYGLNDDYLILGIRYHLVGV